MSVQFGLWNFDHATIEPNYVAEIRATLAAHESEEVFGYSAREVQVFYRPFQVTPESDRERQPFLSRSGRVVMWDGRLDNRKELTASLRSELRGDLTDVAIAAAALESWGIAALGKLIGDWALSVWDPAAQTVLLAKDFLGAKALYYTIEGNAFAWSTLIDPLLFSKVRPFRLQEEYIAGWFSHFPATHLTPFVGIHSVPPATYVLFRPANTTVRLYWNFDPNKKVSYRDDREYEEHFRTVFGESVRRRLRSTTPVLAELSGGMDSSSIVCMADVLTAGGFSDARLDTISYFDHSEPNWDEAPFFEKVEQQRGRAGRHIALDFRKHWHPICSPHVFAGTPGAGINLNENADYEAHLRSGGYRVLLQGIGGDESLGGVPTPLPELANLLVSGRLPTFLRQLMTWAVARKIPALYLLVDTLRQFLPTVFDRDVPAMPTWLHPQFASCNARALRGYPRRFRLFGPLPSFQANMAALDSLRRQIGSAALSPRLRLERRYPYLDRDLLEYLYAVPREQIVRPSQRRSLMRRALVGIVPGEILNRRRKAFIARAPLTSLRVELPELVELTKNMTLHRAGIVDAAAFRAFLTKAADGGELPIVPALRTLLVEAWLSHLEAWTGRFIPGRCIVKLSLPLARLLPPLRRVSSAEESPNERR
jgi:asparagine synthase (glutamine-hydrolysing)